MQQTPTIFLLVVAIFLGFTTGCKEDSSVSVSNTNEKWSVTLGASIKSTPALGVGTRSAVVYIGAQDKCLYAIDIQDGRTVWTFGTSGNEVTSPVVGSDGTVYVGSDDGYLYAISDSGVEKWRFATNGKISSCPTLGDAGEIYLGSADGNLYCLNASGNLTWSYALGVPVSASPVLAADGTIYVGAHDGKIYALNANGSKKWEYAVGGIISSTAALGFDQSIYVASEDGGLYALTPLGQLLWYYRTGGRISASPTIDNRGVIYLGCWDGNLYAIDKNGALQWKFYTGAPVRSSAAITSGGHIHVGCDNHNLYSIRPDGSQNFIYLGDAPISSSPIIGADGTLYVGSQGGKVHAVAVDSTTAWPMFGYNAGHIGRMPAQWTFMVYVAADNNLESFGLKDVNEMELAGSNAQVNVIVMFDRSKDYDKTNGDWDDTRRGIILQDSDTVEITTPLTSVGECNMGNPDTLAGFVRWGMNHFPANRSALVLWNHGGGWLRQNLAMMDGGRDICWDESEPWPYDYLSTHEVGTVLADLPPLDVIGCDACLMAMLECMYEWRKCGVFVGSENNEPGDGWPYHTILADLLQNPTATPEQLGGYIVQRYRELYGPTSSKQTLAAFYLRDKITTLAQKLDGLARASLSNKGDWDYISAARDQASFFPNYSGTSPFRDIRKIATYIATSGAGEMVRSKAEEVVTALENARICYYGDSYLDSYNHDGAYGISVYFTMRYQYINSKYNATNLSLAADTQWDEFLLEWQY